MHEHEQDDPEVLSEIEKLGYDPRDVPVEQTPKHAYALFISFGVMMLVAALVMWLMDRAQGSRSVFTQPLPERRNAPADPYPLLQSNLTAKKDIHDLRDEEAVKTDTAGWVDESKGTVRIPVATAIELVLKEGLPTTSAGAAPASVTGQDPASPGTAAPTADRPGGGGQ
jgi:hypothetical protein